MVYCVVVLVHCSLLMSYGYCFFLCLVPCVLYRVLAYCVVFLIACFLSNVACVLLVGCRLLVDAWCLLVVDSGAVVVVRRVSLVVSCLFVSGCCLFCVV